MSKCLNCQKNILNRYSKYCSNKCQADYNYSVYISKWKLGLKNGNRGNVTKNLSGHIIRYILDKYNNKCSICGWNEINLTTNKSPLEIDHIDGNSENNTENNLILLCPNCHSLTKSYKNLNKGHGRLWRREKYGKMV